MKGNNGFVRVKDVSFLELLISSLLVEFIILFLLFIYFKTGEVVRDAIRKRDLSQIGQIITNPCFVPEQTTENREYDLSFILREMREKDNLYATGLPLIIKDPKAGTDQISMYIYKVSRDGQKCSLYTNLESFFNKETLKITRPTPGGGTGILKSVSNGWNGSPFYLQYSN